MNNQYLIRCLGAQVFNIIQFLDAPVKVSFGKTPIHVITELRRREPAEWERVWAQYKLEAHIVVDGINGELRVHKPFALQGSMVNIPMNVFMKKLPKNAQTEIHKRMGF